MADELRFQRQPTPFACYAILRNGRHIGMASKDDTGDWNAVSMVAGLEDLEVTGAFSRGEATMHLLEMLDAAPEPT